MERIALALILVLLAGCAPFANYIKRLEPYEVPITKQAIELCQPLPKMVATSFEDVMNQKILESTLYKDCAAKHATLRTILESLNNVEIIRITTSESKGSSTNP